MGPIGLLLLLGAPTPPFIVWIPGPAAPALVARLDGQLSDLAWRLERGAASAGPGEAPADAAAVVWFEPLPGDGLRLRLAVPDGRRWHRDIQGLGRAAAYEAAALVLRSALLAIEEGATPTWTGERPVRPRRSRRFGWSAAGRAELTGLAAMGGVMLDGFARWSAWTARLATSARWPATVRTTEATVRVERYDVALQAGWDHPWSARWAGGARVGGGLSIWHRVTRETAPDILGAPDRWLVGAHGTVAVRLGTRIAPGWALALDLGLDAVFGAPRFAVGDRVIREPWPLQPWVAIGVAADALFAAP